jgi:cytochrome c peroxidase
MKQAHIQGTLVIVATLAGAIALGSAASVATTPAARAASNDKDKPAPKGRRLFERETFGGNGRTCLTCHSRETGTVSPEDAQERIARDPEDPLFRADGSDDGMGNGVTRMLTEATILMSIPLAPNVRLAHHPTARTVTVLRGIPTTLNTPALDPVLMYDGREPDLESQALHAVLDHAEATRMPFAAELQALASFQRTPSFFSSARLLGFARTGRAPSLPEARTASERRGRLFFEDKPFTGDSKPGICAICHSGPMLNETNEFIPVPPFARGGRFQTVFVSEINAAGNPVLDFLFENPDGSTTPVSSPDPGRAVITGDASDLFQSLNAFKIPTLWGASRTAPYFHDNSAKTLEDVLTHYVQFFAIATDPAFDGNPAVILTEQDQADIIAFLKRLR